MLRSNLVGFAAFIASGPALATSYLATPATPIAAVRLIAADISWQCGPAACQGSSEYSRPILLCQDLAKKAGPITAFLADGRAFAADDLAKCNVKARQR